MRKANLTNQIAGYSILFRGLVIFGASFLFWKFSLCDWWISIMWPISCNMSGWIWLAYVNKENYRISLKAIIFSSQDLYPAIWLVEIGSPNVNKENRRVTLISYYIPVMWPESCNMIGWNCVCQCKQRKSLNIADQALYFGHVTWIMQSDWCINVNKESRCVSMIS